MTSASVNKTFCDSQMTWKPPELASNAISSCPSMHASNLKNVEHLFSSDTHCPRLPPNTSGSTSSTLYAMQPKDGVSFVETQVPHSIMQSTQLDCYPMENIDSSWNAIENFLDAPLETPLQNGQIKTSNGVTIPEDWADQLIAVGDDALSSNWSDLLLDVNLPESVPQVCFSLSMPALNR